MAYVVCYTFVIAYLEVVCKLAKALRPRYGKGLDTKMQVKIQTLIIRKESGLNLSSTS